MIGQTVFHYKILEQIGRGGMGVVFRAEDTKLGRHVALKFLPPELTSDDQARTRFLHEARAASALEHRNICVIHQIDETEDGRMFIAMALYDGESLKERIARGSIGAAESVNIALQIAERLNPNSRGGPVIGGWVKSKRSSSEGSSTWLASTRRCPTRP